MPRYTWKGIDLDGNTKRGTLTATSSAHLKELLLRDQIALLSHTEGASTFFRWPFNRSAPGQTALVTFFEYLCHLLDSGVPLLKSLELVSTQVSDARLMAIVKHITEHVKKGESFSVTLKKYPETFSPIIVQLITSGEKTGKMVPALTYLCAHLKEQDTFKKTLLQAAIFPLFTIAFAIIIMIGILLFVIPQFEGFFSSAGKTLPPLTKGILAFSTWLRSWQGVILLSAFVSFAAILKFIIPKNITHGAVTRIPVLGNIIMTTNLIHTLRILSLFLKAGIPLKEALETIGSSIKNPHFKKKLHEVTSAIIAGQNLAGQLPKLAPPKEAEVIATFVTLGQQTGKLDTMLDKAAGIFEEKLKKTIALFTLFFQPALMIVVGLIIAILMASVYLPLFNLAYTVA